MQWGNFVDGKKLKSVEIWTWEQWRNQDFRPSGQKIANFGKTIGQEEAKFLSPHMSQDLSLAHHAVDHEIQHHHVYTKIIPES
ncbi:unnamed protein product [Adineta ricciae]|uniref:Uncharacterized protein n=1 Tax=Adineta ricciae TaxID=249248 RepID=A0A814MJE7_ADIRI|nr:unnamed protein product [Adineta ricciae]